ncbi:glycosyltransferase family 2 protein [Streptomyces sp. NPDC088785]|uniref:glycosyltransferase family 2 protein n=1 Tax=Streptomyces sp. NPDC088785 TaxID=3365897 RepID=UPI0037F65401
MSHKPEHLSTGVIVPALNCAETIDRALASIAAQTRPVDRVVVVNDGSDDSTGERAKAWQDILPLTLVDLPTPTGIWNARHQAIEELDTRLVLQLDSDDFFHPAHVEVMVDTFRRRPGLISPRPLIWRGGTDLAPSRIHKDTLPREGLSQLEQLLVHNYVFVGAMFDRALYHAVGGYRPIRYSQDWDLWIRMVEHGAEVIKPHDATYVYRSGAPSYSAGVDRDITDVEVLDTYLRSSVSTRMRHVAKIALLQRMGPRFLDRCTPLDPDEAERRLHAAGLAPGADVLAAASDDDLGVLVQTRRAGPTTAGEAVTVLSVVDHDLRTERLRLRATGTGLQVEHLHEPHLRLRRPPSAGAPAPNPAHPDARRTGEET